MTQPGGAAEHAARWQARLAGSRQNRQLSSPCPGSHASLSPSGLSQPAADAGHQAEYSSHPQQCSEQAAKPTHDTAALTASVPPASRQQQAQLPGPEVGKSGVSCEKIQTQSQARKPLQALTHLQNAQTGADSTQTPASCSPASPQPQAVSPPVRAAPRVPQLSAGFLAHVQRVLSDSTGSWVSCRATHKPAACAAAASPQQAGKRAPSRPAIQDSVACVQRQQQQQQQQRRQSCVELASQAGQSRASPANAVSETAAPAALPHLSKRPDQPAVLLASCSHTVDHLCIQQVCPWSQSSQ